MPLGLGSHLAVAAGAHVGQRPPAGHAPRPARRPSTSSSTPRARSSADWASLALVERRRRAVQACRTSLSRPGDARPKPELLGVAEAVDRQVGRAAVHQRGAIYNEMRSSGPSAITIGGMPSQYAQQLPSLSPRATRTTRRRATRSTTSRSTWRRARRQPGGEPVRYIFQQTYFRQAFQHLVDQPGWINAFLHNTADPTCGPVPSVADRARWSTPRSISANPCQFSISPASQILSSHGWKVVPGGTTTCRSPDRRASADAGIKRRRGRSRSTSTTSPGSSRSRTR